MDENPHKSPRRNWWLLSVALVLAGLAVPVGIVGVVRLMFEPWHRELVEAKMTIGVAVLLAASSAFLLWLYKPEQ